MLLIKNNACTLIIVKQFLRRMKYSIFILFNPGKYPDRGQACQNIPFKSRRRAVSHHRNRIPKRVRKYHSDIEPAKKRPSNKYRKRRDQKTRDGLCSKNKMVTHIWHAKRFHMSVIDGNWSVPLTGKSFSEAFILASTNPQYDKRLIIELQVQYMKIASSEHVLNKQK